MKINKLKLSNEQKKTIKREKTLQKLFCAKRKKAATTGRRSGIFRGRCVWTENEKIYISDMFGITAFYLLPHMCVPLSGDLVTIAYEYRKHAFFVTRITIDKRPEVSPLAHSKTPYQKLLANEYQITRTLADRSLFFRGIHTWFGLEGFTETATPTLVHSPGVEKYLEVFQTTYTTARGESQTFYLPTSPEFSLKEALSSGLPRIYELAKCFRNHGEDSDIHRPEFIMLEWYRTYEDYTKIIHDCAELALYLNMLLSNTTRCQFKGHSIDLSLYEICTLKELFAGHGIDLDQYTTRPEQFMSSVTSALSLAESTLTKGDLFFKFMLEKIEPTLGYEHPVFICEYPYEMTPLSEKTDNSPLYGKRFEMYICGVELANGYGELTDAKEQMERFTEVIKERREIGGSELPYPHRFINAMNYGIPPCSGVALGTERLFMILKGLSTIGDTMLLDLF